MSSSKSISREIRKILYGSASLLAGLAMTNAAQAQDQAAAGDEVLEEVVVKGIRASLQASLATKRDSISVVDAITAEDVGKFPDKNLAEALQRVPGVTINREFGEGERVNLRGTAANLTRTLYNGHALATADWFVLDQLNTTRSFNYLMLPSDIIGQVVVTKTPTADLEEGGIGGTINVVTRDPIDLEANSVYLAATGAYTELADEFDPQASAFYSWKNDADSVGLLLSGLYQERNIRRDGVEVLGYFDADPSAATLLAPSLIGSALFQQERIRTTGNAKLQLAPSDALDVTIEGLYSKFDADNINENFLAWGVRAIGNGGTLTNPTIVGDTAVAGTISSLNGGVNDFGVVYDAIDRFATSETRSIDLDSKYRPSDDWELHFRVGYTDAEGNTDSQPFVEFGAPASFTYDLRGSAPQVSYVPNAMGVAVDPTDPTDLQFIFSSLHEILNDDDETYAYADATRDLNAGMLDSLSFGAKYTDHNRELIFNATTYGGFHVPISTTPAATFAGSPTPSDFLDEIAAAGTLTEYWQVDRGTVEDLLFANLASGPGRVFYPQQNFSVQETAYAGYVMGNLEGEKWRGNVGVRYVQTDQTSQGNIVGGGSIQNPFGNYDPVTIDRSYDDVLPQVNFVFDLSEQLKLRAAAARVMARPDFTDIAPRVSLNPGALTGTSGNPELDPYRANQADLSVEWYMDQNAYVALAIYYKDIKSFITDSPVQQNFNVQSATSPNVACTPVAGQANTFSCPFLINQRSNGGGGKIQGAELAFTTPSWAGFGLTGNYTYTDAEADNGDPIPGSSEDALGLTAFFENNRLGARLSYTYRSEFFVTFDRSTQLNQDELASLDAAVNFNVTDSVMLTAEAINLTNETIEQFATEKFRPRAAYDNGRIFYVGARLTF
jgi:iron complex outermembrane receptor protein